MTTLTASAAYQLRPFLASGITVPDARSFLRTRGIVLGEHDVKVALIMARMMSGKGSHS